MSLPRFGDPVIDPAGRFTVPWFRFFERLNRKGPAEESPTVSASPAVLTPSVSGFYTVNGGTVSAIAYRRGTTGTFITSGVTAGFVPVRLGDAVRITYSSAPTVTFFPD